MHWLLPIPLIIATVISAGIAIYGLSRRPAPGSVPFVVLNLGIAGWAFGYIFELTAHTTELSLTWAIIEYFFMGVVSVSWLALTYEYSRQYQSNARFDLAWLLVEPVLFILFALTNDYHGLVWSSVQAETIGTIRILYFEYGLVFTFHLIYFYLLMLSGTLMLVRVINRFARPFRRQALALIIAALIPWTGSLAYIAGIGPFPGFDLTPFLFAITGPILAWALFKVHLLDLVPVAYENVVQSLADSVIVLDLNNRIIHLNPAAERLTGWRWKDVAGKPANRPTATLLALHRCLQAASRGEEIREEMSLPGPYGDRYYDLSVSILKDPHGNARGRVAVLRDITRHKQAEQSVRRRAGELAALNATLLDISAEQELPVLLETIVERAAKLLNVDAGSLFLADSVLPEVHCAVSYNGPSDMIGRVYRYGDGISGKVAETGKPLIVNNYPSWPGQAEYSPAECPFTSVMAAPLIWHGQTEGVIAVSYTTSNVGFKDEDLELLTLFASQAAMAVERARLFNAANQRAQEAETLRQATAAVAATLKQEEAIENILVQLGHVLPYDRASVQLLRDGHLEIVGGRGWNDIGRVIGRRFPVPGNNPNTLVIEERDVVIVNNKQNGNGDFTEALHDHIQSWLGVPLIVRDQVIGMLSIDSGQPNFFTFDQARLARAFADQVAIAIENARLYATERKRVRELDALHSNLADISAELELSRLLHDILERAASLLGTTGAELGIFDHRLQKMVIVTCLNMDKDYTGIHLALGEGAMGLAAKNMAPVIVSDYQTWKGRSSQYNGGPWRAVIAVPLVFAGELVGAIGLFDSSPSRQFSETDQHLLTLFAQQASIAIQNARLFQFTKQAAERRAILHQVSQEIVAATLAPETIYQTIHKAAVKIMPCEAFTIALINDSTRQMDAVYLVDRLGRTPGFSFDMDKGLSGHVAKTHQSLLIDDLATFAEIDMIPFGGGAGVRSILTVPMMFGKTVVGVLSTQSYRPYAYTSEDQNLLEMLAAYAAIALENSRLFSEIQHMAVTDPLTGVHNRRHLFSEGQREFIRAMRYTRPLSGMMVDADFFKHINDTYGHNVGDQVLIGLTQRLRAKIRDIDILGRYGGDEFVILLPETNLEDARLAAERLRSDIESAPFETDAGPVKLTASMGVAMFSDGIKSLEALIDRADAAAYRAKQAGRNRVMTSG